MRMQLYTHREDVDLVNSQQLNALPAQAIKFAAQDSGLSTDMLQTACPVSNPSQPIYTTLHSHCVTTFNTNTHNVRLTCSARLEPGTISKSLGLVKLQQCLQASMMLLMLHFAM